MATAAVQFAPHPEGYAVSFRYNPALVEAVKATVPPASRRWVPAQKHWLVDLGWADELVEVLTDAGYKVIGFQLQRSYDDWARSLFAAVGMDRAPAVHRALSTVLHPDKPGGSAELQRQLNDGRRQVEERQAGIQLPGFDNQDPPDTRYSGGPDQDWIFANATEPLRSFAKKYNVPIDVVVRRSQTPEGFGALINECRNGIYRASISTASWIGQHSWMPSSTTGACNVV